MLDRFTSSPQRRYDARSTVTMRRDKAITTRRLLNHGLQLRIAELLMLCVIKVGSPPATSTHFDERGTTTYLSCCRAALIHSGTQSQRCSGRPCSIASRSAGSGTPWASPVAGRHANWAYSAVDSRSDDTTFGYRFHDLMASASELTYGSEARVQSGCQVVCCTGAGESGRVHVEGVDGWRRVECRSNDCGRPRGRVGTWIAGRDVYSSGRDDWRPTWEIQVIERCRLHLSEGHHGLVQGDLHQYERTWMRWCWVVSIHGAGQCFCA